MCPWSSFESAGVSFCEQRICSLVVEPSNTWTNIGYFLVALFIFYRTYKENLGPLVLIGLSTLFVGIGSTLLHMTGTFWAEVIDVAGMYFISSFMIVLNLNRFKKLTYYKMYFLYGCVSFLSVLCIYYLRKWGYVLFIWHVYFIILLEILIFLRDQDHLQLSDYTPLLKGGILFALAFLFWNLDFHKVVCNPNQHILQGHGLWHILNSLTIYYYFIFYRSNSRNNYGV